MMKGLETLRAPDLHQLLKRREESMREATATGTLSRHLPQLTATELKYFADQVYTPRKGTEVEQTTTREASRGASQCILVSMPDG